MTWSLTLTLRIGHIYNPHVYIFLIIIIIIIIVIINIIIVMQWKIIKS